MIDLPVAPIKQTICLLLTTHRCNLLNRAVKDINVHSSYVDVTSCSEYSKMDTLKRKKKDNPVKELHHTRGVNTVWI